MAIGSNLDTLLVIFSLIADCISSKKLQNLHIFIGVFSIIFLYLIIIPNCAYFRHVTSYYFEICQDIPHTDHSAVSFTFIV